MENYTLKASHDNLIKACKPLMDFANEDLPKGFIPPEDWLFELKGCTMLIKQALAEAEKIDKLLGKK